MSEHSHDIRRAANARPVTVGIGITATAAMLIAGLAAGPAGATTIAPNPTLASRVVATSAEANSRIAAKLPLRSISAAIGSNYSINVTDALTGETIWSRGSSTPLLTASNMKIVTAVSALSVLGPQSRMTTKVYSIGKGAIAILGGGDTALGPVGVRALARKALAAVRSNPALAPGLETPAPYRPATCRINGKKVKSTKAHRCPLVRPGPRQGALKIYVDDSMYPAPTVPSGWRGGYEPSVVRPVRALAMDGHYVMDAGADTANFMASYLRGKGLSAGYAGRVVVPGGSTLLGTRASATVADQVKYMLQVSENNVAEMLYRNVAIAKGYVGNWSGGQRAATEVMTALEVPTAGLALTSGSGVSRNDRMTTVALTTLLQRIADRSAHPELDAIYYGGGLPLAGVSGTLSASNGRFVTKPTVCARAKIRAKTGTLFDTIGLSGLTVGTDGRLKAFSILVNSRPQKYSPLATRKQVDRLAATVNGCY